MGRPAFGWTDMRGARRVMKDDPRLAFGGDLDELNCLLGAAAAEPQAARAGLGAILLSAQENVLAVGCAGRRGFPAVRVRSAAETRRRLEAGLPRLRGFVLPGGCRAAVWLHLARAVCRRAERGAVALARRGLLAAEAAEYLNALSGLLFSAARRANAAARRPEVLWSSSAYGRAESKSGARSGKSRKASRRA
ncbi:MAG: cob(I)yrinic acid a,c-diamide adenosyltransferase [Elusimicrobia bacterium]|nr:cob(I)yrinic acid a,c-diamide adenosyltransferase [Elusimicrobiota bacterium]